MIFVLVSIVQSVAISLGVGCSTVAIVNFFVAISDGKIDEQERKMMGVVYILLRVAMVLILLTTSILGLFVYQNLGYIPTFVLSQWIVTVMLFVNATLMTKRIMPSNIGPALQAATWYTLGVTMALVPLTLSRYSLFEFLLGYAAAIALAVSIVNGVMTHLKHKKPV